MIYDCNNNLKLIKNLITDQTLRIRHDIHCNKKKKRYLTRVKHSNIICIIQTDLVTSPFNRQKFEAKDANSNPKAYLTMCNIAIIAHFSIDYNLNYSSILNPAICR